MGEPGLFFVYFDLFQTNINTILQQINVKKCTSRMRRRDLNPRPSDCESPPITTRPGLPPRNTLTLWGEGSLWQVTWLVLTNQSAHLATLIFVNDVEDQTIKWWWWWWRWHKSVTPIISTLRNKNVMTSSRFCAMSIQCDQIGRNFATLATFLKSLEIF